MNRFYKWLFLFLMIIPLTACDIQGQITITKPVTRQANEACIDSFDNFAFSTPNIEGPKQEVILPRDPWQVEASLPEEAREGRYNIAATRSFNKNVQIWLQPYQPSGVYQGTEANVYNYLVYETSSKTWTKVPARIEGTIVFVDRLFISSDGFVWGRNTWDYTANITEIPAFSKYNEIKNRFEFDANSSQIPNGSLDSKDRSSTPYPNWNAVLFDPNDLFWIFADQDAIYSYDPENQSVIRHTSLKEFQTIRSLTMAPDGTIYFRNYDIKTEDVYLQKGQIYRYFPSTEEIEAVQLPEEQWPAASSILADKSGRLWLVDCQTCFEG